MISIDRSSPTPLPAQIAAGIRAEVANGALVPGDEVPSTRDLSNRLGVSRGSVVTAYDLLAGEGYLLSSQGAATRIHPGLTVTAAPSTAQTGALSRRLPRTRISLKPSPGNAGAVRPAAWRKAWRDAADDLGGGVDKAGEPELRAAIAEHLRLARGMAVAPQQVVVTGGSREGLMLALHSLGHRLRVGVEDPGHPGLRRVVPMLGHTLVECASDAGGVDVDKLPCDLDALLVTPAHLYPHGGAMPAPRRGALLQWAHETHTLLIEDDFNAELRYRIAPQPTLGALSPSADVLTLGTFSTLLSRELAAGYVVASPELAPRLRETRAVLGMPVATVTQRAIANLLSSGVVRRNTKATHAQLAKRRIQLQAKLLPVLAGSGAHAALMNDSGADISVRFGDDAARTRFEHSLTARGVECGHESALWSGGGDGLVLSFAHLTPDDFVQALQAVAAAASGAEPGA